MDEGVDFLVQGMLAVLMDGEIDEVQLFDTKLPLISDDRRIATRDSGEKSHVLVVVGVSVADY